MEACSRIGVVEGMAPVRTTERLAVPLPGVGLVTLPLP